MERPRVVVEMFASVDGRITPGANRSSEEEVWQSVVAESGAASLASSSLGATQPEVRLEGSGSFLAGVAQEPGLLPTVSQDSASLYEDFLPETILDRGDLQGWFAVVDSRGRLRWTHKEDRGTHLLLLVSHKTPAAYLNYLKGQEIPYLIAGNGKVDLEQALRTMANRLGVTRVRATGGGGLNGALLQFGLVDEVIVHPLPTVVGDTDAPTLFDLSGGKEGEALVRLTLILSQSHANGAVQLQYEVMPDDYKP